MRKARLLSLAFLLAGCSQAARANVPQNVLHYDAGSPTAEVTSTGMLLAEEPDRQTSMFYVQGVEDGRARISLSLLDGMDDRTLWENLYFYRGDHPYSPFRESYVLESDEMEGISAGDLLQVHVGSVREEEGVLVLREEGMVKAGTLDPQSPYFGTRQYPDATNCVSVGISAWAEDEAPARMIGFERGYLAEDGLFHAASCYEESHMEELAQSWYRTPGFEYFPIGKSDIRLHDCLLDEESREWRTGGCG